MRGSFGADLNVCWRGGARGALGASSYPEKFKAGLAEKLITSQEGYQLYFCIGGGGGYIVAIEDILKVLTMISNFTETLI